LPKEAGQGGTRQHVLADSRHLRVLSGLVIKAEAGYFSVSVRRQQSVRLLRKKYVQEKGQESCADRVDVYWILGQLVYDVREENFICAGCGDREN
jgi:hypothetical protein